jgi:hypothetical protein
MYLKMKNTCLLFCFLWILSPALLAQTPEPTQQGGYSERWVDYDNSEDKGLGIAKITMDYTGTASIRKIPAIGQHPRIYFNNADTTALFNRLRTTVSGKAIFKNAHAFVLLLHKGNTGYKRTLDYAKDEAGNPLIANVGLWDLKPIYTKFINNDASVFTGVTLDTRMRLASVMAMEAFECLMNKNGTDVEVGISYAERAKNLSKAMTNWATIALSDANVNSENNRLFGGINMALCYDLNYWAMTDVQRNNVRKALAKIISAVPRYGDGLSAYSSVSNWAALNSFEILTNFAIEGEQGYKPELTKKYARTYYNFLTYGHYPSGEAYEGTGKNYVYATSLIALAKRGYSLLGHPNLRAFAQKYLNALAHPFGYGFVGSDVWGGHGTNPALGGYRFNSSDPIGLKYIFPNDVSVDYLWKTYISTSASNTKNPRYVTQHLPASDGYYNYLIMGVIFGIDYNPSTTAAQGYQNQMDYFSKQGGLGVMRSGFDSTSMMVLFNTRQNNGGHTHANRNDFTLDALGRTWVQRVYGGSEEFQSTKFHNCILIDGKGIPRTYIDGHKARQPAKVIGWISNSAMSAVTGDATYSYNWEWDWFARAANVESPKLKTSGWTKVSETPNSFQQTPIDLLYNPKANTPYYSQPAWSSAGKVERMVKFRFNKVEKVKRTAALVRAAKPYFLLIDDIKKDNAKHLYKWNASIPSDLTIERTDINLNNSNYRCDVILKEATGNRRLLVRVLQNEGYTASNPPARIEPYEYTDDRNLAFDSNPPLSRQRLVIESNSVEPKFKVLFFPFMDGESLPVTNLSADKSTAEIIIGSDRRSFVFGQTKIGVDTTLIQMETTAPVQLKVRAFLQGAMLTTPNKTGYGTMMRDDLRIKNLIPTTDPYRNRTGFVQVNNPTVQTITSPNVLTVTGNNAIVDWVFVELRDKTNAQTVIATKSGLIQRDGNVVDVDGVSPLSFDVAADNYYVVLRHRNHLGVMSKNVITFNTTTSVSVDFTSSQTSTYGTNAQAVVSTTTNALWAGDANADGKVISAGANTDVNTLSQKILTAKGNITFSVSYLLQGYDDADIDLNGTIAATGGQTDGFLISLNILRYATNQAVSPSFTIIQQLP